MKGTEFKKLMWLYADEAMIRKRKYVRGGKIQRTAIEKCTNHIVVKRL